MSRVILVGCSKQKSPLSMQARYLYTSPLFKKRRAYAEAQRGARWFILSASHDLLPPLRVIRPYDLTLAHLSYSDREEWGARVAGDLADFMEGLAGVTIEVHAGKLYAEPLSGPLTARGARVLRPMAGLGIGQQLAWYGRGE